METRIITRADAPALAVLHAGSFPASPWSFAQIESTLALMTTRGWAAIERENIRGFILCQSSGPETEILTFCVAPDGRRHGMGARLLADAIAALRHEGAQILFLEVAADNRAALALYEKSGFQITGHRPNYYHGTGTPVDALMLSIKLQ